MRIARSLAILLFSFAHSVQGQLSVGPVVAPPHGSDLVPVGKSCGAYVTGMALRILGSERPSFERLLELTHTDTQGNCSMFDVAAALTFFGLGVGSDTIASVGKKRGQVFIGILRADAAGREFRHFVLGVVGGDGTAALIVPPSTVRAVNVTRLDAYLDSRALAIYPDDNSVSEHGQLLAATGATMLVVLLGVMLASRFRRVRT